MCKYLMAFVAGGYGLFFSVCSAYAFSDTAIAIMEIKVVAPRWHVFKTGQTVVPLDSAMQAVFAGGSLADVLSAHSLGFVRANGLTGLSTASVRGMDAAHFQIQWQGINVTNPMNGTVDWNLFPANMFTGAEMQIGGAGTQWGSGAVAGALVLQHPKAFNKGVFGSAQGGAGSFNHYFQHYKVSISLPKCTFNQQFFHRQAQNNFPYFDYFKGAKIFQPTSQLFQQAYLADASFAINHKNVVQAAYWYQWNTRNIPTAVGSPPNETYQHDESHRISIEWQSNIKNFQWLVRSGWVQDQIIFAHHRQLFYFFNQSQTAQADVEMQHSLSPRSHLRVGLNVIHAEAKAKTYSENPSQSRTSAFCFYKLQLFSHSQWQFGFRQQWIQGSVGVPVPSIGVEQDVYKKIVQFHASGSGVYRYPTLNDLFWQNTNEAGNPRLLPEKGWSADAGIHFRLGDSLLHAIEISPTIFMNKITNRIFWRQTNSGTLSPINIDEVWARGIELKIAYQLNTSKLRLHTQLLGNYTQASITQSPNAVEIGKQLPHVPFYTFTLQSALTIKGKIQVGYLHPFTGFRYSNTQNTAFLNEFNAAQAYLSGRIWQIGGLQFNGQFKILNTWNNYYEVMEAQPMPGRHYLCTVVCTFYSPKLLKIKS